MDTPKALFAGLALIAVAILFNGFMQPRYTIAGGAGAGPTWKGRSGIHTHCTNTRVSKLASNFLTNDEQLSFSFDVRLISVLLIFFPLFYRLLIQKFLNAGILSFFGSFRYAKAVVVRVNTKVVMVLSERWNHFVR